MGGRVLLSRCAGVVCDLRNVGDRRLGKTAVRFRESNVPGRASERHIRSKWHRQNPTDLTSIHKVALNDDNRTPFVGGCPPDFAALWKLDAHQESSPIVADQLFRI